MSMEIGKSFNEERSGLLVEENPSIKTTRQNNVTVEHKAAYNKNIWTFICPSSWDYQDDRAYFHVLENGIESNHPVVMPTFLKFISTRWFCLFCNCDACIAWCFTTGCCTCVPRSNCCNGIDNVSKTYFDRGIFDRQAVGFDGYCGNDSVLSGKTKVYEGSAKYVCCTVDCPEIGNEFMECYFPLFCGERVFVQPFQSACGYDMSANWCCNCFSLCGLKDGEPLCLLEVTRNLAKGEGIPLKEKLQTTFNNWFTRVNGNEGGSSKKTDDRK